MKRKLAIEIDCGDKTCGRCKSVYHLESEIYPVCGIFGKSLTDNKPMRLPECLAAEIPDNMFERLLIAVQRAQSNDPPLSEEEIDELLKRRRIIDEESC